MILDSAQPVTTLVMDSCVKRVVDPLSSEQDIVEVNGSTTVELNFLEAGENKT